MFCGFVCLFFKPPAHTHAHTHTTWYYANSYLNILALSAGVILLR